MKLKRESCQLLRKNPLQTFSFCDRSRFHSDIKIRPAKKINSAVIPSDCILLSRNGQLQRKLLIFSKWPFIPAESEKPRATINDMVSSVPEWRCSVNPPNSILHLSTSVTSVLTTLAPYFRFITLKAPW